MKEKYTPPSCFGRFPVDTGGNQECDYCGCNDPAQVKKGKPGCREATDRKIKPITL